MRLTSPQPAAVLLAWSIALLAMLHEAGMRVTSLAAVVLILALFMARRQSVGLLRRSRWLLLATVVAFGWMTPGMPVDALPGATGDGLRLAAEQASRLVISIAMTAMLLAHMDLSQLLSALHGVARPLRWLGLDADRGVLRLALVLEELNRPDRDGRGWALLDESAVVADRVETIRVAAGRWGIADACLLLATLGIAFVVPN